MKKDFNNSSVFQYHLSDFYNKHYKIIHTIFIMFILLFISHLFNQKTNVKASSKETETINYTNTAIQKEKTKIVVYISGEVNKPDVYTIAEQMRLKDLIDLAGGFTIDAYTENLNLAQKLYDEDHIQVLNKNDFVKKNVSFVNDDNVNNKININTASVDELIKINGVGEKTAKSIISYREEYGRFSETKDIIKVSGIGEKTYASFKDEITVR